MPTVPYTDTLRVVVRQTYLGDESINVMHVNVAGNASPFATLAAALDSDFTILYGNTSAPAAPNRGLNESRPTNVILESVRVYDLRVVPNPPPIEFFHNIPGAGALGNVPYDVAACLTLLTSNGTRRGRGRVFIGPLGELSVTAATATNPPRIESNINSIIRTAFVDLGTRMNAIVGGAVNLAVLSVADGVSRTVTQVRMDARPDTQRRRDLQLNFGAPSVSNMP